MRLHTTTAIVAAVALAAGARAQQARTPSTSPNTPPTPSTRVNVVPADASMDVTLTVRGANADKYLSVNATNADVRDLMREMAQKAGVQVVLAPSAAGRVTGTIDGEPVDKAMATVAAMTQLSIRKIVVPSGTAASLSPDAAGGLAEALASLPVDASVTDPASGKTLVVQAAATKPAAGQTVVYYLQGKLTPEQERMAREQRAIAEAKTANPAAQNAVQSAVQSLSRLPLQDRMQAMRDMQRQMWQNMSPQDRQAMRNSFRQQRGDRRQRNGIPGN